MSEDRESRARTRPIDHALFGALILIFVIHALWLAGVSEDAFITFHFAQNWVAGHGIVWNPGEVPVEGYTNFLWLVLSALALSLGLDLPLASQVLGFASSLGSLVLAQRCGLLLGWSPQRSLIAPLILACSGPFAAWAGAGLETNLFGMWVLCAIFFHASFALHARSRDLHLAMASLVLAALTRPEGIMVAGVLTLAAPFSLGARARGRLGRWPWAYLAIFLAYFGWRWLHFGYFLPNTFYAKTGGGIEQISRGAHYAGLFALHFLLPWLAVVALAIPIALPTRAQMRARPLLPLAAAVVVSYSLYIVAVGGDYMAMYRFFAPILPLLALLLAAALVAATERRPARPPLLIAAAFSLALLGSLFHSTPLEGRFVKEQDFMHGNYRGIELERWYVARHELIGRFFARYGEPDESIATGAIGGIAYWSGLRVYDTHGIVDPYIAHRGRSEGAIGEGLPGHEKSDYLYVFSKKPTFYVFNRKLFPEPFPGLPSLTPEVDPLVAESYKVGSIRLEDAVNEEVGYFAFLERRDRVRKTGNEPAVQR